MRILEFLVSPCDTSLIEGVIVAIQDTTGDIQEWSSGIVGVARGSSTFLLAFGWALQTMVSSRGLVRRIYLAWIL